MAAAVAFGCSVDIDGSSNFPFLLANQAEQLVAVTVATSDLSDFTCRSALRMIMLIFRGVRVLIFALQ